MTTSSEHTQLTLFTTDKTCTQCGETKPLTDYYADKTNRDRRKCKCKTCIRANTRAWREVNPERSRAQSRARYANDRERQRANARAWRKANPERIRANSRAWKEANRERSRTQRRATQHRRRARKAAAVPQRWQIHDILLFCCYWCGANLRAYGATTHIDHVMPISLGGPADPTNEVKTCATCNLSKRDTHPLVWIAHLVTNN
ncbi:MAG: HNH endonuclease [Ilumatobacteraceae bacterium]